MPFSLLYPIPCSLEDWIQSSLRNRRIRDEDSRTVFPFQQYLSILATSQNAKKPSLAGDGLQGRDSRPLARKAEKIRLSKERSIQTRRGHFKRVGMVDDVLYVKKIAQLFAHSLAIIQGHPIRFVEIQAQDPSACLSTELNVYQLQSQLSEERKGDRSDSLYNLTSHVIPSPIKQRAGVIGPLNIN